MDPVAKEFVKYAIGGSSFGIVFGILYLLLRIFDTWWKRRTEARKVDGEEEISVSTEWRRYAKTLKDRIERLENKDVLREKEMQDIQRAERKCQRLYNVIRIRCDRYEEAMRQAGIPFEPFDSALFDEVERAYDKEKEADDGP